MGKQEHMSCKASKEAPKGMKNKEVVKGPAKLSQEKKKMTAHLMDKQVAKKK